MANRIHIFSRMLMYIDSFMELQKNLVKIRKLAFQFFKPFDNYLKKNSLHKKLFLVVLILVTNTTNAWVYPEHRQIALLAIQNLSSQNRELLDKLWAEARKGFEARLTQSVIDANQGRKPTQLDYAAWFAISGDHSCSPQNLLHNVLQTDWILNVADVAEKLKIGIENSKTAAQHINELRSSDIDFQKADPEYATRAGSNNIHFLLARPEVTTDATKYLTACLASGAELNALGAYAWFHTSAMLKAGRYAEENLTAEEKSALILAALAEEAFALHFLEDAYAAGHIAGTWGDASVRKGTHDYYNEKGLEVVTWDGKRTVVKGDAYMRPQDAEFAAVSIRLSLEQLLNAARGKIQFDNVGSATSLASLPDSFNVCKNTLVPSIEHAMPTLKANYKYIIEILVMTPVPGLATGDGELPRFRSELGKFIGFSSALNGSIVFGGFGQQQTQNGFVGGVEANVRFGFGLDGVLNQAADGLVYIQVGWKLNGSSTNEFINHDHTTSRPGSITSAIPGRTAYTLRIRSPFYLIPGDLLVAGPVLLLTSPKTLTKMGVVAANGGLLGWQKGISTRFGRFAFVLGREVGISFYGLNTTKDDLIIPSSDSTTTLLQYRSTQFSFPIIEYRPFRTFSLDQSSGLTIELNAGFDVPHPIKSVIPGDPIPSLKYVWQAGVRIVFNWRRYLK